MALGLDRATDETTVICCLQMFSDDALMHTLMPRLSDREIGQLFDTVTGCLKRHLSESEYHRLFLRDDHP